MTIFLMDSFFSSIGPEDGTMTTPITKGSRQRWPVADLSLIFFFIFIQFLAKILPNNNNKLALPPA